MFYEVDDCCFGAHLLQRLGYFLSSSCSCNRPEISFPEGIGVRRIVPGNLDLGEILVQLLQPINILCDMTCCAIGEHPRYWLAPGPAPRSFNPPSRQLGAMMKVRPWTEWNEKVRSGSQPWLATPAQELHLSIRQSLFPLLSLRIHKGHWKQLLVSD